MQVIVKCWTPEWYDAVSHAVIPMNIKLIDTLLNAMKLANKLMMEDADFSGLQYNRFDPYFIDVPADLVDQFDISEDDFDYLCDDGYHILPDKMDDYKWDEVSMRPCMLMVIAGDLERDSNSKSTGKVRENSGRIYWYAYDKHGGAEGRVETYSLSPKDLRDIREQLLVKV